MGQFINSDCNTWKVSRPSPQCYFMAAHKSRPGRTTAAATTAIKINTAVANTIIGRGPLGQSAANSCHKNALSAVCTVCMKLLLNLYFQLGGSAGPEAEPCTVTPSVEILM